MKLVVKRENFYQVYLKWAHGHVYVVTWWRNMKCLIFSQHLAPSALDKLRTKGKKDVLWILVAVPASLQTISVLSGVIIKLKHHTSL